MGKKKVNPRRIPLPNAALNTELILDEAMKDNMKHAWQLVIGPLLEGGYDLTALMSAVNEYIKKTSDAERAARVQNKRILYAEMLRAEKITGISINQWNLNPSLIKSQVELQKYKKKVQNVALNSALAVICLGLDSTALFSKEELRRIFFSADLTMAEIETGMTSFEEIERSLGFQIEVDKENKCQCWQTGAGKQPD